MSGFSLHIPPQTLSKNQRVQFLSRELSRPTRVFDALSLSLSDIESRQLATINPDSKLLIYPEIDKKEITSDDLKRHQEISDLLNRLNPKHAFILNGHKINHDQSQSAASLINKLFLTNQSNLTLWGQFNLNHPDLKRFNNDLAIGLTSFTTPFPLLKKNFEENLHRFRISNQGNCGVTVAVPYITDGKNLLKWLEASGLNPAEHHELQIALELFERAKRDKDFQFAATWNQAQIEYCSSLIGISGINFMPMTALGEALPTFRRATAVTIVPVNPDILNSDRIARDNLIESFRRLPSPIKAAPDPILFSQQKLPGGKSTYSEQCLPLISNLPEAFSKLQAETPDSPLWRNLRVKIQRPTMKIAQPAVSISGFYEDDSAFRNKKASRWEIAINLLPFIKISAGVEWQSILKKACQAGAAENGQKVRLKGAATDENEFEGNRKSALMALGMQGYALLEEAARSDFISASDTKIKESSSALFPSAERHAFVELCANHIEEALNKSNLENPVYLEPGCYEGHGVKLLFTELNKRAKDNLALGGKLKKLTFLFSDFNAEALKTCSDELGDCDQQTGIRCKYLVLDSTLSAEKAYHEYQGRVIGGRAVNVFDAFPSDYVASIDGDFYKIAVRTHLNLEALKAILAQQWQDNKTDSRESPDFDFNSYGISSQRLVQILNSNSDNKEVENLLNYLTNELNVPRHRALFLWKKIFESCLEQEQHYIKLKDSEISRELKETLYSNPGNYIIPDSNAAIQAIDGIIGTLNPGASFLSIQLVTGIHENRATYHRMRLYGLASATPISAELMMAWARYRKAGVVSCERILGEHFDLANTNSALIFKK